MSIEVTKRPYNNCFSGNPIHYELHSAVAEFDSTIYFEIKVKYRKVSDTVFTDVVTLPYYPTGGKAEIDLAEIIDGLLKWDLPRFNPDPTTIWDASQQTCFVYIEFREISSANTDPSWDTSEEEYQRFIVKGGINDYKWQGNNFWVNYYAGTLPFLTWQKSGRMAAYKERMYLSWLKRDVTMSGSLFVKVQVTYTDASTDAIEKAFPSNVEGLIYLIPAGAEQWDLNSLNPSKKIWYWTVTVGWELVAGSTFHALSEVFRFEQDNRNDDIDLTLNYRNSLGGLDSVRIAGSLEKKTEYEYTEVQNTIEPDYFDGYNFKPQKKIVNSVEQLVYVGNTRPVSREEADRLRDMHVIRDCWHEKGEKWVPINNITKGFSLDKSDDMLWSMPFEFTLGYNGSKHYTPDNVDLGDGQYTSNVCQAVAKAVNVLVLVSGGLATFFPTVIEVDPEGNSDQVRYRILAPDGTVVVDWTTILWADIATVSHSVTENTGIYKLEMQPICANNIWGKKSIAFADSSASISTPTGNSLILNNFWMASPMTLIDLGTTATLVSGGNPSFGQLQFNVADGLYNLRLTITDFSPAVAHLSSNGTGYIGTIAGNIITWTGVNVIGGLNINIY